MYGIQLYILLGIVTIICIGLKSLFKQVIDLARDNINIKRRSSLLDHYVEIIAILEQAKEIAYKKVWQEEIALENVSGFRIHTGKVKTIQNRYVKLVLQYCGDNVVKDLVELHGNIESVILFLISGLIIKLNEDELSFRQLVVDGGGIEDEGEGKTFVDNLFGMKSPPGVDA